MFKNRKIAALVTSLFCAAAFAGGMVYKGATLDKAIIGGLVVFLVGYSLGSLLQVYLVRKPGEKPL